MAEEKLLVVCVFIVCVCVCVFDLDGLKCGTHDLVSFLSVVVSELWTEKGRERERCFVVCGV